ncbi:MAG: type II CAAX endopeptidase family protein [Phycisphaerales bacterium]|nr:type II CAAX endopeptidase family protein [Phycisphaerales bacterium]
MNEPNLEQMEGHPKKKLWLSLIIFGLFIAGIVIPMILNNQTWYRAERASWPRDLQYIVHPAFRMVLVLIGWGLVSYLCTQRYNQNRPTMGLLVGWKQGFKGALIGFLCSIPMLLLGLICTKNVVNHELIYSTLLPGFTEEVFYRAFAFGLMMQVLRFKLWTSAILTGVLFGLAHLISASVRSQPLGDAIGWIGMIALGGLFYAWLYERANWNLWIVILLHASMNLWWDLFDLTSSSMGNWGATISRILAVGLAIYFVVFRGVLRPPTHASASTIDG